MTKIEIEKEINIIVSSLKDKNKINLALNIQNNWQKTLITYSKELNSYQTQKPMELILKKAFSIELNRLEYKKEEIKKIIKYIENHRILQTSPHLSPTSKPRFFFINYLSTLALSKKDFFPILMFSGVPFSNKTRPGRLSKENEEINLIPSSMQDDLVYRNIIPEKMITVIKNLPKNYENILSEAKTGESYTKWALHNIKKIEEKLLNTKPVFLDFNEIITNYLLLAIKNKKHIIHTLLFNKKENQKLEKLFKEEVFFYAPILKGKYYETESFFLKNGKLKSLSREILLNPKNLEKKLKEERLCPALPLSFLILSFLNDFLCLGSFAQIEYLPIYISKFKKINSLKKYNNIKLNNSFLTTGSFSFNPNLHPLDIYINNQQFNPNPNELFGESLIAIKDILLNQNYSINLVRK